MCSGNNRGEEKESEISVQRDNDNFPNMIKNIDLPIGKIKGKERIKTKKPTCSYITTKMLAAHDSLKLESSLRKSTRPKTFRYC